MSWSDRDGHCWPACCELGQETRPTSAGSWGQARLFEALLLERLASRSPTVLVVEDLHWADRSTLDLLAFLVRNLQGAAAGADLSHHDQLPRPSPSVVVVKSRDVV